MKQKEKRMYEAHRKEDYRESERKVREQGGRM